MSEQISKVVAGTVLGIVVGWGGSALTLSGRVSAIEAGQARIEQRLDQLIRQEKPHG